MTSDEDFRRLESKVDKLTDAVMRLVLIEERQSTQAERIGKIEADITVLTAAQGRTERAVSMWVNRGIGVWGLAVALFTVFQVFKR
jgi:hypothetical protein